jgi:hypothetical protein
LLVNFSLEESSFVLAQITGSTLRSLHLADCTLLYVVLDDTELDGCVMNLETVGTIFGLSAQQVGRIKLRFLGGDAVPNEPSRIVETLVKLFANQRWAIQLATTRLNFRITSALFALNEYWDILESTIRTHAPLRRDELTFVGLVMDRLADRSRLPLLAVSRVLELAQDPRSNQQGSPGERQREPTLAMLGARASTLATAMIETLMAALPIQTVADDTSSLVTAKLVFQTKPTADVQKLISDAAIAAGLPLAAKPKLLSTRLGSFVLVLSLTVLSAVTLNLLLFLLNGMLIQLQEAKARVRQLRKSQIPERYSALARQDRQVMPPILREPLRRLIDFSIGLPLSRLPDLGGLSETNIESIEEIRVSKPQSSSRRKD